MKISLNWLRNYVDWPGTVEELASGLTMAGLEVESIERLGEKYNNFVVGQIVEVQKHPNADKLTVCSVSTGRDRLRIVCGAPNVARGQKVVVGRVGAVIPRNQHDPDGKPFVLDRIKIRGVDSEGMICSEFELGLGSDAQGILILPREAEVGTPLATYLGLEDTVLEIGITPNRPDCLSHLGVAREVAAIFGRKLKKPAVRLTESKIHTKKVAGVRVENLGDCPRYTARVVRNASVGPSPKWIQDSLKAVGLRPVNNVVDVTNYVLMEIGHPLHAFDFNKLEGHRIVVKRAKEGQAFTTLDGKTRTLRSDTLMICDGSRPVAIAGVMGGANTEITDSTKDILIESAYFDPRSIRRTSRHLGLSTDASQRFERGADPSVTEYAVDRCAQLVQEVCGGEVLKGAIDVYPKKIHPRKIPLRTSKVNGILGTDLSSNEITRILSSLEIENIGAKGKETVKCMTFAAPTSRPDLEREIDLIEEVARIYGYDHIKTKLETGLKFSLAASRGAFSEALRNILAGHGFREIVTNSMQPKSVASISGTPPIEVLNPISEDMSALRTSLVPGVLEVIRHNIDHGTESLRLFEIGNVFRKAQEGEKGKYFDSYVEEERLIISCTGRAHAPSWDVADRPVDPFDLKGEFEALLQKIFLDKIKYIYYPTTNTLSEFCVGIEINGGYVGFLGKLRFDIAKEFGIEQDVYLAEVSLHLLQQSVGQKRDYVALPKFPPVRRDLAIVVDSNIPVGEVEGAIRDSSGPLLNSLRLFDLYTGNQIESNKKSCAFSLEFLSGDRTLTEEEIDLQIERIVRHLRQKLNAELRS
jgi:phenylalanyl-tRNA synthetase beta chain